MLSKHLEINLGVSYLSSIFIGFNSGMQAQLYIPDSQLNFLLISLIYLFLLALSIKNTILLSGI